MSQKIHKFGVVQSLDIFGTIAYPSENMRIHFHEILEHSVDISSIINYFCLS